MENKQANLSELLKLILISKTCNLLNHEPEFNKET